MKSYCSMSAGCSSVRSNNEILPPALSRRLPSRRVLSSTYRFYLRGSWTFCTFLGIPGCLEIQDMQVLTWVSVFSGCFGLLVPFWQRQAIGIKSDAFGMSGILHFCSLYKCILSTLGTSQIHWCFEA